MCRGRSFSSFSSFSMWTALAVVLTAAGEVFAAEEGGDSIFGGGFYTSLLSVIVFVLLLVVLGRFAWKPLLEALNAREETIRGDLDKAKSEREQAEKLLAEYRDRLAKAQAEAEGVVKSAAVAAEKVKSEILEQAQTQAAETVEQARAKIDAATMEALREIYRRSATLATELAANILQREVNAEDHRVLITQALDKLGQEDRGKY